jgi:hypothetical protein
LDRSLTSRERFGVEDFIVSPTEIGVKEAMDGKKFILTTYEYYIGYITIRVMYLSKDGSLESFFLWQVNVGSEEKLGGGFL